MEVTLAEFNAYINDYNDTAAQQALKIDMLNSAQSLVEDYLGYTLGEAAAEETYTWLNKCSHSVMLPKPCEITTLKINGDSVTSYLEHGRFYVRDKDNYYRDYRNALIEIKGYWNLQPTPDVVKMVILKIASLLAMETNKRIGVTGVQLPDGNGHQYVSYTNYKKHLLALNPYRAPWRYEIGKSIGAVATAVVFTGAEQIGGIPTVADTESILLVFDENPATLTVSDITVTGATKGTLSGSGTVRILTISAITVLDGENVTVAIASPEGYTLTGSPKTVAVYVEATP